MTMLNALGLFLILSVIVFIAMLAFKGWQSFKINLASAIVISALVSTGCFLILL